MRPCETPRRGYEQPLYECAGRILDRTTIYKSTIQRGSRIDVRARQDAGFRETWLPPCLDVGWLLRLRVSQGVEILDDDLQAWLTEGWRVDGWGEWGFWSLGIGLVIASEAMRIFRERSTGFCSCEFSHHKSLWAKLLYDYFEEKNSFFLLFENRFLRLRSFLRDSIDLFDERLRTRNILL